MYEMKYIAQRSQRTLVVAEMPAGCTAVAGACAMVSPLEQAAEERSLNWQVSSFKSQQPRIRPDFGALT
jgi:hypothetical protein